MVALDSPFTPWFLLFFPQLQRGDVSPPEQAFFVLHKKSSDFVSFECKNLPGTYIGVKDNQLAIVEEKDESCNNIMFKLSKI